METNNRILLVDDNHSIHDDYRAILCPRTSKDLDDLNSIENDIFGEPENGDGESTSPQQVYEVDSAFQGTEAIKMVRQAADEGRPYALIFMDVRMPPGIDGIEAISQIWKEYPYIEMVICTAFSDYSWDEIVTRLGTPDKLLFLKKPFASIAVKQMAQSLVTKWNLGEQSRRHTRKLEEEVRERTRKIQAMLDDLHKKNEKLLETQAELRDTEAKFKVLTASSTDGIVLMDNRGKVSFWNPASERMFGFKVDEILGQDLHSLIAPERYHADFRKGLREFQKSGRGYFIGKTLETAASKKNGIEFPVEISLSALQVKEDWYAAGIIRDITERKEMEKQMKHMAHYDMLTGLPNRTLFFDRFAQFLSLARRHKYILSIFYLDLDKFKYINDTIGHDMGDRVLKEVATRLNSGLRASDTAARMHISSTPAVNLRESDTVARIGGDEFIVLLSQIADENNSAVVAERIISSLTQKIRLYDHEFSLEVSIGISVFPHDGDDMETLIRKADAAMYQAKARGGNCYQTFIASSDEDNNTATPKTQENAFMKETKK